MVFSSVSLAVVVIRLRVCYVSCERRSFILENYFLMMICKIVKEILHITLDEDQTTTTTATTTNDMKKNDINSNENHLNSYG